MLFTAVSANQGGVAAEMQIPDTTPPLPRNCNVQPHAGAVLPTGRPGTDGQSQRPRRNQRGSI